MGKLANVKTPSEIRTSWTPARSSQIWRMSATKISQNPTQRVVMRELGEPLRKQCECDFR